MVKLNLEHAKNTSEVMERTVTDKWTTRDETGAVVDQWAERSWHGESSGLHRRGDGTGETWRRAVEVNPEGRTSFLDNRRLYARDYVVEVGCSIKPQQKKTLFESAQDATW
ncbi:hypothetical protein Tcan_18343 [Toxocara canis]|uniref:Head-tail adaptor protein n=2 Tax=Toxocara canis TaxID=6265 RepID=A0A0B2UWJ4_TOXCA|nr:hypothetical protein Tcan_18343 [Toxocara canis]VDM38211.1 unnamed protein product [Toxocara canis]